jgi:hypothetical protein
VNPDVAASIAAHYLGRPATPPVVLSLESAWLALTDEEQLRSNIESLAPLERKLLAAIEEVGGEVDTEELLDLEREPMRLRGATGATPSRRGVGFALERRGFLIPVHPNRHVIPTEVAAVVGERRRAEREAQRREILSFVLGEDHAPRRARFAEDPVPLVVAMAITVRDPTVEVRAGVGTPRSLIARIATRFGRSTETVALLASLSRAVGLWDASVMSTSAPPGSYRLHDLGRALFEAWRRGGAWDEARPDGEVLRVAADARESSPIGVIREIVLEALSELGDGNWAPWEAVAAYVRADPRAPAWPGSSSAGRSAWASRLRPRRRWRAGSRWRACTCSAWSTWAIRTRRTRRSARRCGSPRGGVATWTARPAPGARAQPLRRQRAAPGGGPVPGRARRRPLAVHRGRQRRRRPRSVAHSAGDIARAGRRLRDGGDARAARGSRPIPDPIARLLVQASAVVGRAEFVNTEGFLWVEDPEVREMLRTRRATADLFVDPSPPAGLLVAAGVDMERLARRCRGLGVEVIVEGEVYKTRTLAPSTRGSGARRLSSDVMRAVTAPTRRQTGSTSAAQPTRSSSVPPARSSISSRPPPRSSTPPPDREGAAQGRGSAAPSPKRER